MPARRFFQLHLSTAVVLMLVASVLLWANVRERTKKGAQIVSGPVRTVVQLAVTNVGWPWTYRTTWQRAYTVAGPPATDDSQTDVSISNGACNAATALLILLAVWQLCEWRIRRRAAAPQESP